MARQNTLFLIIGALVVVVIGFAVYTWNEEQKEPGVEISIGQDGVKVEGN